MAGLPIKKAVRQRVWTKIAITGPTGAGKTWGGIALGLGLAPTGKLLVVDTENESSNYYADRWAFDVLAMHPPFTPLKYMEAVQAAVEGGYEVLVIDSLTHEWASAGGILDAKAAKDARGGSSFANWADVKAQHHRFVEALLQSPIHVIGTLRSKMEYAQEADEKGRSTVRKIGLAPITSDGMEYEFGIVFDVERNTHLAVASKDRTGLFDGRNFLLTEAVGKEIRAWLDGAAAPAPAPRQPVAMESTPFPPMPAPRAAEAPSAAPAGAPPVVPPPAPEVPKDVPQGSRAGQTEGATSLPTVPIKPPVEVTPEAAAFVDGVCPPRAKPEDVADVTSAAITHKVSMDSFWDYLIKKRWVFPNRDGSKDWTSMSGEACTYLLPILQDPNRRRAFVAHLAAHHPAPAATPKGN